jgi:hypothetical protein
MENMVFARLTLEARGGGGSGGVGSVGSTRTLRNIIAN